MKYYESENGTLHCGDSRDILKTLPDNSVTAIVTDPPYGLKFMGKKWDYDVPSVEMFTEMLRVLKPGGTMLCFAGSRTQHRMAVNVEDAGFILKDCIMWIYGSGFPKATDISKQLDRGHKREVTGRYIAPDGNTRSGGSNFTSGNKVDNKKNYDDRFLTTEPSTTEAKLWNGWKSHGLKPAYEPIILAMKPNDKTYANNALAHGVSGINIDGCRIGTDTVKHNQDKKSFQKWKEQDGREHIEVVNPDPTFTQGRFPANIILDEEAGAMLDEQSGTLKSGSMKKEYEYTNNGYSLGKPAGSTKQIHDSNAGGASRFFYCAKASRSERNAGCDNLEEKFAPKGNNVGRDLSNPKAHLGGMQSSKMKNSHPTVKPLSLMTYLTKLVKMPEETIILDPFAGSGSTLIACVRNNIKFIGIEMEAEYCEIAKCRIENESQQLKLNI